MNFYITSDAIGVETGGGLVTFHESESLKSLGQCEIFSHPVLDTTGIEPWMYDYKMVAHLDEWNSKGKEPPKLAHFYSGTFPLTIHILRRMGTKIVYTIAAHDRKVSMEEHAAIGMNFPYTHLTDQGQWNRYIDGYRMSDCIITPGKVPEKTIRGYGKDFRNKRIEVIPHGCRIPQTVKPLPSSFAVGYMGAVGPDKGLIYLLSAWKNLNYRDATLVIAGKESQSDLMKHICNFYGGGDIRTVGWVKDVSDFYNSISLYVQPSATEGFGLEVNESLSHGRPVICSNGAGACDVVTKDCGIVVPSRNAKSIAESIDWYKNNPKKIEEHGQVGRDRVRDFEWGKIRQMYKDVWNSVLEGKSNV